MEYAQVTYFNFEATSKVFILQPAAIYSIYFIPSILIITTIDHVEIFWSLKFHLHLDDVCRPPRPCSSSSIYQGLPLEGGNDAYVDVGLCVLSEIAHMFFFFCLFFWNTLKISLLIVCVPITADS